MKAKRILCLLLSLIMLSGLFTASVSASGAEKVIFHNFDTTTIEHCAACLGSLNHENCWANANWNDNYDVFHQWCEQAPATDPLNSSNRLYVGGPRADTSDYYFGRPVDAASAANRALFYLPEGNLENVAGVGLEAYTDFLYSDVGTNRFESFGVYVYDSNAAAYAEYAMTYGQYINANVFTEIDLFGKELSEVNAVDEKPILTLSAANFDGSDPIQVKAVVVYFGGVNLGSYNKTYYIDNIFYKTDESASGVPKAYFDNGVETIEAVDGKITMPQTTVDGKQFLGWQTTDGALYAAGAEVSLTKNTAFTAVAADIALQTGAGIRWAEAETERGIRFETYVTKEALDKIGSSSFELGALILPYEDYQADITVDNNYGAINVVDPKVYGETSDGNYRYYTGVVDFEKYFEVSQSAMADLKLTAVSYVKVTYNDGAVKYFYDYPNATDNVRTVAEVARAALADTSFGYTEDQIKILNLYNKYSLEANVPEYRKDRLDKVDAVLVPETEQTYNMTEIIDSTRMIGRAVYHEDDNSIVGDWTASGFEVGMVCSGDVSVDFSVVGNPGLMGVVVDEDFANMKTYNFSSTDTTATFDTNMTADYHKIRVMKLNECDWQTNGVTFESITLKGIPDEKPAEKDLKIEVIGDSISCGWGIMTTSRNSLPSTEFGFYEDGSKTYASMLAQRLDADINTVARSGIGALYGFGGSKIIDLYDSALPLTSPNEKWDFSNYTPDIVLINLGTNDSSQAAQAGVLTYDNAKAAAQELCDAVRKQYPDCTIVWLEGMMYNYDGTFSVPVREVISGLDNAYYCLMSTGTLNAADGHPTYEDHQMATEELYTFLKDNGLVD